MMVLVSISAEGKSSQIYHLIENGLSNPITKTIRHLKRVKGVNYISWRQAHFQAHIIHKYAEIYNINWRTIVAITFIESSFDQFLGKILEWGPMQVSRDVWKRKCIIINKTIEGGYQCGILHLKNMYKRYSNRYPNHWYGYFNSSTPKYLSRYLLKVNYQLQKIDKFIARSMTNEMLYL